MARRRTPESEAEFVNQIDNEVDDYLDDEYYQSSQVEDVQVEDDDNSKFIVKHTDRKVYSDNDLMETIDKVEVDEDYDEKELVAIESANGQFPDEYNELVSNFIKNTLTQHDKERYFEGLNEQESFDKVVDMLNQKGISDSIILQDAISGYEYFHKYGVVLNSIGLYEAVNPIYKYDFFKNEFYQNYDVENLTDEEFDLYKKSYVSRVNNEDKMNKALIVNSSSITDDFYNKEYAQSQIIKQNIIKDEVKLIEFKRLYNANKKTMTDDEIELNNDEIELKKSLIDDKQLKYENEIARCFLLKKELNDKINFNAHSAINFEEVEHTPIKDDSIVNMEADNATHAVIDESTPIVEKEFSTATKEESTPVTNNHTYSQKTIRYNYKSENLARDKMLVNRENFEDNLIKNIMANFQKERKDIESIISQFEDIIEKRLANIFIQHKNDINNCYNQSGEKINIETSSFFKKMIDYNKSVKAYSKRAAKQVTKYAMKNNDIKTGVAILATVAKISSANAFKMKRKFLKIQASSKDLKKKIFNVANGMANIASKSIQKTKDLTVNAVKSSIGFADAIYNKSTDFSNKAYDEASLSIYKAMVGSKNLVKKIDIPPKAKIAIGGATIAAVSFYLGSKGIPDFGGGSVQHFASESMNNNANLYQELGKSVSSGADNYARFVDTSNGNFFSDVLGNINKHLDVNNIIDMANNKFNSLKEMINNYGNANFSSLTSDNHQHIADLAKAAEVSNHTQSVADVSHHAHKAIKHTHSVASSLAETNVTDSLNSESLEAAKSGKEFTTNNSDDITKLQEKVIKKALKFTPY